MFPQFSAPRRSITSPRPPQPCLCECQPCLLQVLLLPSHGFGPPSLTCCIYSSHVPLTCHQIHTFTVLLISVRVSLPEDSFSSLFEEIKDPVPTLLKTFLVLCSNPKQNKTKNPNNNEKIRILLTHKTSLTPAVQLRVALHPLLPQCEDCRHTSPRPVRQDQPGLISYSTNTLSTELQPQPCVPFTPGSGVDC